MKGFLKGLLLSASFILFVPVIAHSQPRHIIDVDLSELHDRLELNDFNLDQIKHAMPAHPLIPFTTRDQLEPCSKYLDVEKEFKAALECSNREIFSKPPYNQAVETLEMPECYVITTRSPDVYHDDRDDFNFISLNNFFLAYEVVGFYDDNTIYIVQNEDDPMILRHELQQYFLEKVTGDGNPSHNHQIWKKCEPPYYIPSAKMKDVRKEEN